MDLADFPHLKKLDLFQTAVTGDIRDISDDDFASLDQLTLPKGVYGGVGYEFQRISDGTELVRAVYLLQKELPCWWAELSKDSPDWYISRNDHYPHGWRSVMRRSGLGSEPPFCIRFVKAGSRIGYRWEGDYHYHCGDTPCEVNWLDPEPESGSREYEDYLADYNRIQGGISPYRGHYEPPTEEQYTLLYEAYLAQIQRDDEDY